MIARKLLLATALLAVLATTPALAADDHAGHNHAGHDHGHGHDHDHEGHDHAAKEVDPADKLSPGMVWLATMVTELIVTLIAGLGLLVVPLLVNRPSLNKIVMALLIGLATGTLLGDAIMHLIPDALEGAAETGTRQLYTSLVVVAGAYAFYLVELVLHSFGHTHHHGDDHGHGTPAVSPANDAERGTAAGADDGHRHGVFMKESDYDSSKVLPVAWLIIFGDAVHNFLDGLAVGVSFASSWTLGISTAIAVLLHELPHELGDYAVMLESGIPKMRAALYNMASNLTSFVGAAIGILVFNALSEGTQSWVLAFTAGGFLYIALADLVPMLFQMTFGNGKADHAMPTAPTKAVEASNVTITDEDDGNGPNPKAPASTTSALVAQNVGFLLGVGLMVLVAVIEASMPGGHQH
ncbi:hypothetical protein H9P43_006290 [Blastocladiella emersonii ATCC 22665]|nr:hypothetical protein H9P43_006290 [Blastocladiella emersonii ATCC 22665]